MFGIVVLTYTLGTLNLVPGLGGIITMIAELFGRDATFSNRATIWAIIRESISLHPLLGCGYGAYWIGNLPESPSSIFPLRMYIYPTQSHNGYLEIINDLGYVGLFVLIAFLAAYLYQSVKLMKFRPPAGNPVPVHHLPADGHQSVGELLDVLAQRQFDRDTAGDRGAGAVPAAAGSWPRCRRRAIPRRGVP